jgi:hypothetical protein
MSSFYRRPQRSHRQELEKGTRRKRRKSRSPDPERRFGQSSNSLTLPQLIRRGALLVLLLGFAGLLLFLIRPGKTTAGTASAWKDPNAPDSASILPQEEPATAIWQGPQPIEVANSFTAATTHSERLKWVDQPEEVAALMEEFYTHGPGLTETITKLTAMRIPMQDGRAFNSFLVIMADNSFRKLDVVYELNGHAKVDFKSYSRFCGMPWSALLDGSRPSAAEMRVFLKIGYYYNRDFSDENTWLCLVASSPDLKEPLYLYARRDNSELLDFLRYLPDREMRYTVSIQNTKDGWQHRQFILSKVLRSGWLGY